IGVGYVHVGTIRVDGYGPVFRAGDLRIRERVSVGIAATDRSAERRFLWSAVRFGGRRAHGSCVDVGDGDGDRLGVGQVRRAVVGRGEGDRVGRAGVLRVAGGPAESSGRSVQTCAGG